MAWPKRRAPAPEPGTSFLAMLLSLIGGLLVGALLIGLLILLAKIIY